MTGLEAAPLTVGQRGLVTAFVASGTLHLVRPQVFVPTIPRALPAKRFLVYASGVGELLCAAGMLHPGTRRLAGLASAALLLGVFPANVQMAIVAHRRGSPARRAITLARLPLQLPMILSALRAGRG